MITAGEVLKRKRESLNKSLDVVSIDTKIQRRFLEYLEDDEFDKFDSDIFASGFIKIYSQYLGLDVNKLLALYRRSRPENVSSKKKAKEKSSSKKNGSNILKKISLTPKLIAGISLGIFLLSVVGYIGYQIYQFQKPPTLTISEPQDELITQSNELVIKGSTDSSATLEINGNPVEIDDTGWFEEKIMLNEGLNSVNVKARKISNSNLETERTLRVTYKTEEQEEIVEEVIPENVSIRLEITESSAWIKLDIDDENKISQILEPNSVEEYDVLKSLSLTTGRVSSTKFYIGDEEYDLSSQAGSGVVTISCRVENSTLVCN